MTDASDPVALAEALIACESVTPGARGGVRRAARRCSRRSGSRSTASSPARAREPVENCSPSAAGRPEPAFRASPATSTWSRGRGLVEPRRSRPSERGGELLYGRGAVDMKSSIAAMVPRPRRTSRGRGRHAELDHHRRRGRPGDPRHPRADRADPRARRDARPDAWSASRPASPGSGTWSRSAAAARSTCGSTVEGREGHVAYPHRADNPIPKLRGAARRARCAGARRGHRMVPAVEPRDHRARGRQPGAPTSSRRARGARISIRFNDLHSGDELVRAVAQSPQGTAARPSASSRASRSSPSPEHSRSSLREAIEAETGVEPELSTSGGTSDSRFLKDLAR